MGLISFDYVVAGYSRKTVALLDMLQDDSVRTQINFKIGNAVNQFVPMKTGALRRSMFADSNGVHWSTPYAHYQYQGVVYDVNLPKFRRGRVVGWYSIPGATKYPTMKELGAKPGSFFGYPLGYTTPGTMHHWMKMYSGRQWDVPGGIKAQTNLEITKFLKAECRKRGLKT